MRVSASLGVTALIAVCAMSGAATAQTRTDRWQQSIPDPAFQLNDQAVQAAKRGEYDQAVQRFKEALRLKPDYIAAKYNLGLAFDFREWQGDDARAEQAFRDAIALAEAQKATDRVPLYNTYGWFLYLRGRLPEAKEMYEKALALDPNSPRVLNNLGAVFELLKDRKAALATYKRAADAGNSRAKENFKRLSRESPGP